MLENLISNTEPLIFSFEATCDFHKVILAGSSAGTTITAVLSHLCRDQGLPFSGIILNVLVLCDYRSFPSEEGISNSYMQCTETFLGLRETAAVWNMVLPSATSSADPKASPLLGNTE